MVLGGLLRHRRLGGALALAATAFYAVLLPWHTVSQAITPLPNARSLEPPCHHALAAAEDSSKSPQPLKPRSNCPICKGFAALHLATGVPANVLVVKVAVIASLTPVAKDDLADATAHPPQSRGPPSLFA
jgi:hypothetical protein